MEAALERAGQLREALVDYVLDAEGELATALETFSAAQLAKSAQSDSRQQMLVVDRFAVEGKVGDTTPIDHFLQDHPELSEGDRQLLQGWERSFFGLFAVTQLLPDGYEVMNWLTAKNYTIKPGNASVQRELERVKVGEIILTRISPVNEDYWIISAPCSLLGSLGKPKLAVAIGNFKENYKPFLYSDAPDLLEEAWKSVERYHQDFLDFFGSDEVTLPGYQLGKKITEFQEVLTKKQLEAAGIDESKSLAEMADEAGIDEAEIEDMADTLGVDAKAVSTMLKSKEAAAKMVTPKIELPPELKKAESVTVIAHPRWGQMFLPTYTQFKTLLDSPSWQEIKGATSLVKKYLEDRTINTFVWNRLAEYQPTQLEAILQTLLERPDFQLKADLPELLREYKKPPEPELPEIASVPLHLHNLFQEALDEVQKSKPKDKEKKPKKGFQRL